MGNDASVLDADMDETADNDDITGISQSTVRTDINIMGNSIRLVRHWLVQQLLMLAPLVLERDCAQHPRHLPTVLRKGIM
jgi:hypothetical protein